MGNRGRGKQRGFSLLEVVIAMGFAGLLAVTVLSLKSITDKTKVAGNAYFQADSFRKQVTGQLQDLVAWRKTLESNATFACLQTGTTCSAASGNGPASGASFYTTTTLTNASGACVAGVCRGGFDVYDATGNVFYPFASQTKQGFSFDGLQCRDNLSGGVVSTGALGYPSKTCPFRLVLWWVPICESAGSCVSPMVHVKGFIQYTPPSATVHAVPFSPAKYGIDLILPGLDDPPAGCSAQTGYGTNGLCNLPASSSGSTGVGTCPSPNTGSCSYTCTDGVWSGSDTCTAPAPCSASANHLGSHCDLAARAHGLTSGGCELGYDGACQYTCNNGTWDFNSNSCAPANCIASLNHLGSHCDMPAGNHGLLVPGACEANYQTASGSCGYTCSFGTYQAPTGNACLRICPTGQTVSNCELPASLQGERPAGSCASGYTGSCSYTCQSDGTYGVAFDNSCVAIPSSCSAQANYLGGHCDLAATAHLATSGTCSSGYSGACQYTCNNGTWNVNSNTCGPASCSAQTNYEGAACDLAATAHGGSSGTCTSGYTGSCSYACSLGVWSQTSNSCIVTPPCAGGGASVGGYCWYVAAYNVSGDLKSDSCDNVCASRGGYNNATRTYAGDLGTLANCEAVASALGMGSGSGVEASPGGGYGCYVAAVGAGAGVTPYRDPTPTTSSAKVPLSSRACACNN